MLEPLRAVLDRELTALLAAETDEDLLFAVAPFVTAIESEPRLAPHMTDLAHEADDLGWQLLDKPTEEQDADFLARLWEHLGESLREGDQVVYREWSGPFRTLQFDHAHPAVASLDAVASSDDTSRIGAMLALVKSFYRRSGDPVIELEQDALGQLVARRAEQQAALRRLTYADASVAMLRLRLITGMARNGHTEAVSSPREEGMRPSLVVRADAHGARWEGVMDTIAEGKVMAEHGDSHSLARTVRRSARRVVNELQMRAATTRSRLALIERYKARCEWHDRERVAALADISVGRREAALRDDLATYLFDQGLDPLSEARLGTTRADLFAGQPIASFLLEAKQYDQSGASMENALRAAFQQALDTAGRVVGSGYGIEEAFIVLFRRGGPRALLPEEPIVADGLRWYLRLIDIAPPSVTGARQRSAPIEWTAVGLRRLMIDRGSSPA